jgi:glycosyltransferase involved in cell wall biosynthesis
MSKVLSVYCPGHADVMDSYGLIGTQLARQLTRMGHYVNLLAMGNRQMESQDAELKAITMQPIKPSLGGLFLGYPTGYHKHANPLAHIGPRVAITMFESSKIPQDWIEPLNQMDAVIVPCTFCKEVFQACGVTSPIHIVPLGVGDIYTPAERRTDRPLTFLSFLDRGQRKGGIVALQAFLRAFGDSMDYRLVLKMRKAKVPLELTNPNIEVIQHDMTEQELYELFCRCDVLINPHKGEGFGLIPREFSATGGIALTTNWSGTADDIDAWGWPIRYTFEPAEWTGHKTLAGQDLGVWAKPDTDALANQLQTIDANIDYYRDLARRKAMRVPQLYSWQDFAARVLEVWKEAADGYSARAATLAA